MIPLKLRRKHLRAPLNTNFLFKDELGVQKGIVENISEGGALLVGLKNVPKSSTFNIYFDLPEIPNFSNLPIADIFALGSENFRHQIYLAEIEVRRNFKLPGTNTNCLGCEFFSLETDHLLKIKNYVANYAANIIFTLALFEQGVHRKEVIELIRKAVHLMNYPKIEKISDLRQKLLHDYQSLESL